MSIIKSENLIFEYTSTTEEGEKEVFRAINDVSIEVEKGQFIAVLGHNGSGKSTFAKNLNALLLPTKGTLWVKGYNTKNADDLWKIRQGCGYVFQNPDNQIIATIVEEDVAFGPENLGIEPSKIRKRVENSLAAVNMSEYSSHSPTKLSGGQKQRIAIAGVLAMKPDCIVLDEPTAMLDPNGRKEVLETIKRLNREERITIILITHYMDEAIEADNIFVMDKGRVAMSGKPKEVFSQVEKIKSYGLDVPQVTEIAYNLRKMGVAISGDVLSVKEMVEEICRLKLKI